MLNYTVLELKNSEGPILKTRVAKISGYLLCLLEQNNPLTSMPYFGKLLPSVFSHLGAIIERSSMAQPKFLVILRYHSTS